MPNLTPLSRPTATKPTTSTRPTPSTSIVTKPVVAPPKPVVVAPPKPIVPSHTTGLVKAVFIGINYTGLPELELKGCINDSINTRILIQQLYPTCKDIKFITDTTDTKPTRANILSAIDWLVAGLKPGQNVFFQFSGHGNRVLDTNKDEKSGYDSCIHPYNEQQLEIITDDELRALLANRIPAGCKLFAVFDCCNSGTALDLQYIWQCPKPEMLTFQQDRKYSRTRGDVIFLSACRDEEYAMDTTNESGVPAGALTLALLHTWKTYRANIKYKHLLWDVRQYLTQRKYTQIPQLSSGGPLNSEEIMNLSK
jgi:hypothetical protein